MTAAAGRRSWHDGAMRYGVVEGEPGIFPDPIARCLRAFGRLMRGSDDREQPSGTTNDQPPPPPDEP